MGKGSYGLDSSNANTHINNLNDANGIVRLGSDKQREYSLVVATAAVDFDVVYAICIVVPCIRERISS